MKGLLDKVKISDRPREHPTHRIKTIDCKTLQVVSHEESVPYLTLSYVWGSPEQSSDSTEGRFPQTIKDAISVTRRLGYRHLWVDRYCIDQNATQEKADQIGQMDQIYRYADACIVAAAGDGPHYGLPGVSRSRPTDLEPLPSWDSDNDAQIKVVYRARDAWRPILQSKWASRGWTFQELLFSRVRIFFTDTEFIVDAG
ncbi:HET-domain-containing protein, partial [Aspergillus sclerotiicarbonarius CBS 121057]